MAQIKDILEPSKAYETVYNAYNELVVKTFDDLVKKSEVKVDENNSTCSELYAKQEKKKKFENKHGRKAGLKVFLIVLAVIAGIIGVVGVLLCAVPGWRDGVSLLAKLLCTILGLGIMTTLIIVVCVPLNRSMDKLSSIIDELNKQIDDLKEKAWKQMEALNKLFRWNMPQEMVTETVPLIQLDSSFQQSRLSQINDVYNYDPEYDDDTTVLSVQSGSILGNPFLIEKTKRMDMGSQVYTGSIVISWTEYTTDSNGNRVAVTRTQTLTATVTKPKPFYRTSTYLTYFNEACPKLSFTRSPVGLSDNMSQKQIDKFVKKKVKKIEKLSRKSLKKGDSFTAMGNSEFEALFNATNRNNEVEFRMLFTPIGQKNMIDLIRNSPYGDDFTFAKEKKANRIHTQHAQNFDYHSNPARYISFDYNVIKDSFTSYSLEYLKSLYFDLAPILSIPLYQQYKTTRYIYKEDNDLSLPIQEIESLANHAYMSEAIDLAHGSTDTDVIFKCVKSSPTKVGCNSTIEAASFKAVPRVTIVPVMGGDGRWHDVPVHWFEYIPLSKVTQVAISQPIKYFRVNKIKDWTNAQLEKVIGKGATYMQKLLVVCA